MKLLNNKLIIGSLAVALTSTLFYPLALRADCPGKPQTGGKCTVSTPATASDGCVATSCDQDSTVTGTCAEAKDGSCSTYNVNWTCDKTTYPATGYGSGGQPTGCNTSGIGTISPASDGQCTLTSTSCG